MTESAATYVLIDGENLDMTLGQRILSARPRSDQRPRWDRVVAFAEQHFGGPVRALFFLNASHGLPVGFIAALSSMGLVPVPLSGPQDVKVVDVAIQRTLQALLLREGAVVLGSHDADFADDLRMLADGARRVAVMGFTEFLSGELRDMDHVEVCDLEDDVGAFDFVLPRVRVVAIEDFDPERYL
ncbi:MAG: NYN domain-containing protein [Alphaproteobacteria bacterium]|nr:NYN domain-containing protein [Alphaproteobacteria bacterium]